MAYHVYATEHKSVALWHTHTRKPVSVFSFCFRVNVAQQVSGELRRQTTTIRRRLYSCSAPFWSVLKANLSDLKHVYACQQFRFVWLVAGKWQLTWAQPNRLQVRVWQSESRLDCVLIALQAANWIFIIICFSIFSILFLHTLSTLKAHRNCSIWLPVRRVGWLFSWKFMAHDYCISVKVAATFHASN